MLCATPRGDQGLLLALLSGNSPGGAQETLMLGKTPDMLYARQRLYPCIIVHHCFAFLFIVSDIKTVHHYYWTTTLTPIVLIGLESNYWNLLLSLLGNALIGRIISLVFETEILFFTVVNHDEFIQLWLKFTFLHSTNLKVWNGIPGPSLSFECLVFFYVTEWIKPWFLRESVIMSESLWRWTKNKFSNKL